MYYLVTITKSGNETAGENYTLHCTAAVGSHGDEYPNITWFGPDDFVNPITYSTADNLGILLEITNTANNFFASLKFLPLQSRHNGTYTCKVNFQGNNEINSISINVTGNT